MARLKVSLICSIYNEGSTIDVFLTRLAAQTRLPDEILVGDGGSTDGTAERVNKLAGELHLPLRQFILPGTNIAQARNALIREARHSIIAVTDAGTVPDEYWLERLVAPFERMDSPDVVGGWYRLDVRSPLEATVGLTMTVPERRISPDRVSPSSRSIAFTRSLWNQVGGYPEWLTRWGEDTEFNRLLRAHGARMVFVRDAFVWWRPEMDLASVFRRNFHYGLGDGEAGHWPTHLRLTAILALVVLAGAIAKWQWSPLKWGLIAGILLYLEFPLVAHRRFPSWASLLIMPAARLAMDAGQWTGFVLGYLRHFTGRQSGQSRK